jgi:hypothetical protein
MNHLYKLIWLSNYDTERESYTSKNIIQKNETSNKTVKKEAHIKKKFYNNDDIEKLLLIM